MTKSVGIQIDTNNLAMKSQLLVLALFGAAAPVVAAPANAPKLAPAPTYCAPDQNVDYIEAFARMPDYVFQYFGGTNNTPTNLLTRKGVIKDSKNGFIEIPYAGNSSHPSRAKLYTWQLKLFGDQNGAPVAVVNSTILSETGVKPFIHVFRFKDGYPYRTTAKDWPFKRTKASTGVYENYYLPRSGDIIKSALPESDATGPSYQWNRRKFVRFRS